MLTSPIVRSQLMIFKEKYNLKCNPELLLIDEFPVKTFLIKANSQVVDNYKLFQQMDNGPLLAKIIILRIEHFHYLNIMNPTGVLNALTFYVDYFKDIHIFCNFKESKDEFNTALNILLHNDYQKNYVDELITKLNRFNDRTGTDGSDLKPEEIHQLLGNRIANYTNSIQKKISSIDPLIALIRELIQDYPRISKAELMNFALCYYFFDKPISELSLTLSHLRNEFDSPEFLPSLRTNMFCCFYPKVFDVNEKFYIKPLDMDSYNQLLETNQNRFARPLRNNLNNVLDDDLAVCSNSQEFVHILHCLEDSLKLVDLSETNRPFSLINLNSVSITKLKERIIANIQYHFKRKTVFEFMTSSALFSKRRVINHFNFPKSFKGARTYEAVSTVKLIEEDLKTFLNPSYTSEEIYIVETFNIYDGVSIDSLSSESYEMLLGYQRKVSDCVDQYIDLTINEKINSHKYFMITLLASRILPYCYAETIIKEALE